MFDGYPDAVHVLDDGRLVTVGRRNHLWVTTTYEDGGSSESEVYLPVAEPARQLIAVFGARGGLLYSVDLRDLYRIAGPIEFGMATHSSPFWYRSATITPGHDALTIILSDHNELRLGLDDLTLMYVAVPNEALQGDREKLRNRAEAYLAVDNAEAVSVLEELLNSDPGDHEAADLLTRHLGHEGDHGASIAILRRLVAEHPLGFSDAHSPCNTIGEPFFMRCQLIRAYLDDGRPEQAMAVIETIRPYANPHAEFEVLEIQTLLALNRIRDADVIADRLLARERDSVLLDWHVRRVASMYERRGLHDRADAVFANAVGSLPMDPDLLSGRADEMIRSGRERAAVPLLERLLDSGGRMDAAISLGQIHADDRGDIALDLDVARDWFRIAVDSANAAGESRHEAVVALRRLCQISLVKERLDDAVEWCGELGADGHAAFWMAVIYLDPSYQGHDADKGLELLEASGGPPSGWNPEGTYFRPEYDEQLYAWAVGTLEQYADTGNTYLQYSLGSLYDGNGGRPYNPERALELLGEAAKSDHTDAMLGLAHVRKRMPCDASCWQEVRKIYRRLADLGEKWGYHYLAEIILERGSDAELSTAEDYLGTFSEMSKRERNEWECDFLGFLIRDRSRHSAERLYGILERRLGRPVTRIPDRGCT